MRDKTVTVAMLLAFLAAASGICLEASRQPPSVRAPASPLAALLHYASHCQPRRVQ